MLHRTVSQENITDCVIFIYEGVDKEPLWVAPNRKIPLDSSESWSPELSKAQSESCVKEIGGNWNPHWVLFLFPLQSVYITSE